MATTNHERIGRALELLKDGLQSFVERELKAQHAQTVVRPGEGVSWTHAGEHLPR